MMIINDNDNDKDNDNDDNAILIIYHDIHNNNIINDGVIHGSDINDKKIKYYRSLSSYPKSAALEATVLTTSFPVPSSSLVHALLPSSHSLFIMLLISTYDHHKRNNSKNMKTHMNTTKQPSKTQIFKIKCSDSYSSYKQRQT